MGDDGRKRRQQPAIIECFGVDHPFTVDLGNETYPFSPDGRGRLVSPVSDEEHIACFRARADMYREVGG